ncbi:MAG: hypothetical protein HQK91_13830 [Nitrospirae bacterium]|nr:hypothetical protein [Nitrospirota bacterium]
MDNGNAKKIVEILMETNVFFDLSLMERYRLIKDISKKCIPAKSSLFSVFNLDEDKDIRNIQKPRKLCYKSA